MPRRKITTGWSSVYVLGAPFRFRTFHGPDGSRNIGADDSRAMCTLDKMIEVTLAAVPGIQHHEPATVLIKLRGTDD